jgi:hypothetical protein
MEYVLLIHSAEARAQGSDPRSEKTKAYIQFTQDLAASGRMGDCAALEPTRVATTVRVRGGKRITTDGPFAETREQLGGYYVVKTKDLDEALDLAAKIPDVHGGSIEVRPVMQMPTDGDAPAENKMGGAQEYLLMIYEDEGQWKKLDDAERGALLARYGQFTRSIKEAGHFIAGAPLEGVAKAKTLRIPADKRLVTDGPFAETREQLGGYYRVRAANLDVAMDLASRIPAAESGSIEVRPISDLSGLM